MYIAKLHGCTDNPKWISSQGLRNVVEQVLIQIDSLARLLFCKNRQQTTCYQPLTEQERSKISSTHNKGRF